MVGRWRRRREGPDEALAERFAAVGPWYTRYTVDGRHFGGEQPFEGDGRIDRFLRWVERPGSVLELGSFEGAHSLMLAAAPGVDRVLGLEGRPENIARAELATSLLAEGPVEFVQADLATADLTRFGRFDSVFCAGLLYHLAEPWTLLRRIAEVTDVLFLDTHYSPAAEVVVDGWRGRHYDELGLADPLSGLGARSFWPVFPDLVRMVLDAGFRLSRLEDIPEWGPGPRAWLLAER